jgi:fermentation-respiration switch protein FrsA (DUF1100 family)
MRARGVIDAALIAAAAYLAVICYLYVTQRRMIYFPDPTRPDPASWGVPDMRAVSLSTEDGLTLLAWWRPPAASDGPTILYLHGNAGHIGYRGEKVRPYLDDGLGVLLLAWRGYSGNPGRPSEQGLYEDGRTARRFLAANGVDAGRLVLYGESLGSAVAVRLAADAPPGAVVLEAPFTSMVDLGSRLYPFIPVRWLLRDRFESLGLVERIGAPLLVLHGEGDELVPASMGRTLLARAAPPKDGFFAPSAGHVDLYDHGAAQWVLKFIGEYVLHSADAK